MLAAIVPIILTIDYPDKPIVILSDEDFENYGFSGTGTELDPYIIESLRITSRKTSYETAIKISNTTKFFIIRDCEIRNYGTAIYLYNTGNVTVQIIDNYIEDCNHNGISSYDGGRAVITGNTIINCDFGISIGRCNNSLIENNLLYHNYLGISLGDSPHSIITGNNCSFNNLEGCHIYSSNYSNIHNNIFNNHPYWDKEGAHEKGLRLSGSSFLDVFNNTCFTNSLTCIEVVNVQFSNFSYNNFSLSTKGNGISFESSDNNLIWMNVIQQNNELGIYFIQSNYNIVWHNAFIENGNNVESNAYEELCLDNVWYNLDLSAGNFWFSWNASIPFEISGQGSIDPYPLENNPVS
jgi:parallel beta-helix repeat protein